MKSILVCVVAATSLVLAGSAMAVDMPAVGKAKCGSCHAVDKKVVGPAFMDVSKKYKADKKAASTIAASITKGGSFGWKFGSMPPKGLGATDADIKVMSEFIVGLAK
jgi:cytochrome c